MSRYCWSCRATPGSGGGDETTSAPTSGGYPGHGETAASINGSDFASRTKALADDRFDKAQRQLKGVQHRALLDVGLEVTENLAGRVSSLRQARGIQPESSLGFGQ